MPAIQDQSLKQLMYGSSLSAQDQDWDPYESKAVCIDSWTHQNPNDCWTFSDVYSWHPWQFTLNLNL